ncbi:unnamed protein product [Amaranthus hypochondriacus]
MTSHSYSLDSQSKSSDLAAKFFDANSPTQIAAAIAAVESHLTTHSADQNRHFFSIAFPAFICKFFGFDVSSSSSSSSPKPPSPSGWIDTVSLLNDSDLAGKLFNILSPHGTLINSIMAVDRLSLVKFVFPAERLPEWVRFLLSTERDFRILSDLCPLFKGRIKEDEVKGNFQVHLNVFEYFIFWFAYYPVCRGNSEIAGTISVRSSRKSKLENWSISIPVISSSGKRMSDQKSNCNLYLKLLYAYLRAFVPIDDLNAYHQPYRSSLLHYSSSYDDSVVLRAEFFVESLVHYWLVDNDLSPLAVNVCKSCGLSFPFRSVLGETPPASGLGEVVKLLVNYLNLNSIELTGVSKQVEYGGSPSYKLSSSDFGKSMEVQFVLSSLPSGGSWNSYIQRPVYRFLLRTFLYCPMGSSMKNISEVFSVWISYIEPWKLIKEELVNFDAMADASKRNLDKDGGDSNQRQYSITWQGYVLSNYLFYTSLAMHFIGFAHKFLHTDAETIVRMTSRVIDILTSSKELLELLKNVDTIFHSKTVAGSGKSALSNLNKFIPQIREQLEDWEDGLSENDADGSFLHENWNKDLKLFDNGEDGGSQLLQLFILRAETELQAISGDNLANNLQCLQSLKEKLRCLFGDHVSKQPSLSPRTEQHQYFRDELFKPRKLGKGSIANGDYKGDSLRRPISDDEVAWLAKLLIHLSVWLNETLGLNHSEVGVSCPYVEIQTNAVNEYGMSEFLKVVMCSIFSWVLAMRLAISRLMIRHGLKVNLRVFASKKFVSMVFILALFNMLKRAMRSFW